MRFRQILEIGQLNQLSVFIITGQDLEKELGEKYSAFRKNGLLITY